MAEDVRRIPEETVKREESAGEMMVRIFSRSWDGEKPKLPLREANFEPMKSRGEK